MTRCFVVLALLAVGCGEDGAADARESTQGVSEEPTPVSHAASAANPASAHGGTVVAVGPHVVEVVAQGNGQVEVFVQEGSTPLPRGARVTVRLTGDDGGSHPVLLTWDPAQARYRGWLRVVHAIPGPIEVAIAAGGEVLRGSASTVVVTAPPEEPAGTRVARAGTRPTAPSSAEEGSVEGAADPVAAAPEAPTPEPAPAPVVQPAAVQVRPQIVARPPAATPALGGAVERAPIVNRRARATGTAPQRARPVATEGATVRVRQ